MHRLLLAVVLLVAGCLVFVGYRRGSEAARPAAPALRSAAEAAPPLVALPASDARAPADEREVVPQGVEAVAGRGVRLSSGNPARGAELRLRALDGILGRPVPGARFLWAREELVVGSEPGRTRLPRARVEEILERIGEVALADDVGLVRIQLEKRELLRVHARSGGLAAAGAFGGSSWQEELFLYPDRELEIRVVDEAGAPRAGVVVLVQIVAPDAWPRTIWRAETSRASGSVRIERADEQLASWYGLLRSGASAREAGGMPLGLAADVGYTTFPSVAAAFTLDPWPERPIELRAPATGRLTVLLVDERGALLDEPALVRARIAGLDAREPWRASLGERDFKQARASFEPVQLDLALELEPWVRGRRVVRRYVRGPDASMPELELTLVPGPRNPELSGRLLDPTGAPLANATFEIEATARSTREEAERSSGSLIVETDEAGRFRQQLLIELPEQPLCMLAFSHPARGLAPRRRALRELAAELELAEVELGDVQLAAPDGW